MRDEYLALIAKYAEKLTTEELKKVFEYIDFTIVKRGD